MSYISDWPERCSLPKLIFNQQNSCKFGSLTVKITVIPPTVWTYVKKKKISCVFLIAFIFELMCREV